MNILFYNTTPISPEQGGTERVTDLVSHYLKLSGYTIYYLIRYKKDTFSDNTDIKTYFPYLIQLNAILRKMYYT